MKYDLRDSVLFNNSASEIKTMFPEIEKISFEKTLQKNFNDTLQAESIPSFSVLWYKNTPENKRIDSDSELSAFLKTNFEADTVFIRSF
jgi:hypothetical protein